MSAATARTEYHLPDEPRPSGLSQWAVQPFWPLLGLMLGGVWLSWPWFVLNGFAMGSPTRRRELLIALIGLVGTPALLFGFGWLVVAGSLDRSLAPYVGVAVVLWKLAISYWIYVLQGRTFELYRYYGGAVANGGLPVVGGLLADRFVEPALRELGPFAAMTLG